MPSQRARSRWLTTNFHKEVVTTFEAVQGRLLFFPIRLYNIFPSYIHSALFFQLPNRPPLPTTIFHIVIMAQTNAATPTSRAREQVGGNEEATSELKLGEFQNVHSMSLSEARALIIAILAHRATTKKVEETE